MTVDKDVKNLKRQVWFRGKKSPQQKPECKASQNHKALGTVVLSRRCYQLHCPPPKWET